MKSFHKILVANDTTEGLTTALSKAAVFEQATGAEVEVAKVAWNHIDEEPLPQADKEALIEEHVSDELKHLRRVIESYSERITATEARILWHKYADEALISEANLIRADLLIKPVGAHHGIVDYVATPLDWKILRSAGCPVLISKSREWQAEKTVLAAVDIMDTEHEQLSEYILTTANTLCDTLGAQLHVVTAYPDLGQSVNQYQVAMDFVGIKQDMREAREDALNKVVRKLALQATLHLHEGKPDKVIKQVAGHIHATIAVVGTQARHGLGKVVLGNTAEDILSQLECDILTVPLPRAG